MNPYHLKTKQIISDYPHSEAKQLKASVAPLKFTRNLETFLKVRNLEIPGLHRHLQTMQNTLNNWDEVNFNLLSAETTPNYFIKDKEFNCQSRFKIDCSPESTTTDNFEKSEDSAQYFYYDDFFSKWKCRSYRDSPWWWETFYKEERTTIFIAEWSQPMKWNSVTENFASTAKSPIFEIPRVVVLWIDEVEEFFFMYLTISFIHHLSQRDPILDFENLDFKIIRGLKKIVTRNFKKNNSA